MEVEAKIITHPNLPWLYAVCDSLKYTALVLSFHPFRGGNEALSHHEIYELTTDNWKQVMYGIKR